MSALPTRAEIKTFADLEAEIKKLAAENEALKAEKNTLYGELNEKQEAQSEVSKDVDELLAHNARYRADLEGCKKALHTAEEKYASMKARYSDTYEELQDALIANNRLRVTIETLVSMYGGKIL